MASANLPAGPCGFYGVDGNRFKLDNTVYEAVEDESDGYRSMLDEIAIVADGSGLFLPKPLATVTVEEIETSGYSGDDLSRFGEIGRGIFEFRGFALIDVLDKHCWALIGTDRYVDYYPCFVFHYQPKPQIALVAPAPAPAPAPALAPEVKRVLLEGWGDW